MPEVQHFLEQWIDRAFGTQVAKHALPETLLLSFAALLIGSGRQKFAQEHYHHKILHHDEDKGHVDAEETIHAPIAHKHRVQVQITGTNVD